MALSSSKKGTPTSTATEVSRTITALRQKAGLSLKYVADALKVGVPTLEAFESGQKPMSVLMLSRLTETLGCEDLNARFPAIKPFNPKELAQPTNVHLRLQHLINVVTKGNQRLFAQTVGFPAAGMSPLVNKQTRLTEAKAAQILANLPTLSREWLLTGVGQPFTGAELVAPVSQKSATPEPANRAASLAKPKQPRHDESELGPTNIAQLLFGIRTLPDRAIEELTRVLPKQYLYTNPQATPREKYLSVGAFLKNVSDQNCGLNAKQVQDLFAYLMQPPLGE